MVMKEVSWWMVLKEPNGPKRSQQKNGQEGDGAW